MTKPVARMSDSVALPLSRIALGISGHREGNAAFAANRPAIVAALARIFDAADRAAAKRAGAVGKTRLHSPLAPGSDMIAASLAVERGWDLAAPLPFGFTLNMAVNLSQDDPDQALAMIEGAPVDTATQMFVTEMQALSGVARKLELAEQDWQVRELLVRSLKGQDDDATKALLALCSERAAAASRIVVEQSGMLIAIWDGTTPGTLGGTRHTMAVALAVGLPVLWVDATAPDTWTLLQLPEDLPESPTAPRNDYLRMDEVELKLQLGLMIEDAPHPRAGAAPFHAALFHKERWPVHSPRALRAYRWIEDRFAGRYRPAGRPGRTRIYERPEAIGEGSAAPLLATMRALPGIDPALVETIERDVLQRFAWTDGISTYLSDAYRGGMTLNFILSALAVIGGVAYLPVTDAAWKWPFALFEFLLLLAIVGITATGRRKRWHSRWFQTRRVAEYLRHSPIRLLLGVARAPGQWPRGNDSPWPEAYAREVLGEIGLPNLVLTQPYLRSVAQDILHVHVVGQIEYHCAKAAKLTRVHHNLDHISELCFKFAIASVAIYLLLNAGAALHLIPHEPAHAASKAFTFLGVLFPAIGGAISGIRYFGDFERFAAISEVTAEKLTTIRQRIERLLSDPHAMLRFSQVAELTAGVDDIVIAEIESWQAVFASKTITVPV